MQVCTSLQTDNHASTPPLSFLQAGCPSCRPTNSVKALNAANYACSVNNYSKSLSVYRYACADRLVDHAHRRLCLASAAHADYVIRRRVTSSSRDVIAWSELACCDTDMCNYYYFRSRPDDDVHASNGEQGSKKESATN